MKDIRIKSHQRSQRTRAKLRRSLNGRPRLSVFRSSKNIYAQLIDDKRGHTLAAASTLDASLRDSSSGARDVNIAAEVGKLIAQRAKEAGVTQVTFDRGSYKYHGRVRALAEAAREMGLEF